MGKRLRVVVLACALAASAALFLTGCAGGSEYQPESKSPVVGQPTIGQDGTLRVGVDAEKSPLAGMNKDNKIIGLDVDIAAALADELGLKLSIVDVGTDPAGALSEGKVDVVMEIDGSEASSDLWVSEEYVPTGVALFAPSSSSGLPESSADLSIAAQVSSTSAWAVANEYGDDTLKSTSTLADAFSELSSGSVDYVAADAINGLYAAGLQSADASIVGLAAAPTGYCIGVDKKNTDLQKAVSEALAAIKDGGIVDVLEVKWLGEPLDLASLPQTKGAASEEPEDAGPDGGRVVGPGEAGDES